MEMVASRIQPGAQKLGSIRGGIMAHHYRLKGGSVLIIQYSGLTNVQFSFYIHDQSSKTAAYCWYGSDFDSAKLEAAVAQNKVNRHQIGVGNQVVPLALPKPLDFKTLRGSACSFSLTGQGSTSRGLADLSMKSPAIHLVFPILADFTYGGAAARAQTNGTISQVDTVKTSAPDLPAGYRDPGHSS
jgi:hypothetical protein